MAFHGGAPPAALEGAVKTGQDFGCDHLPIPHAGVTDPMMQDELAVPPAGNPMGRVCRVLSGTRVYDRPDRNSALLGQVNAGELIIAFDDPGPFRQILTHDDIFGYIPRSIRVKKVDMLPAEIHDPEARARVESTPLSPPGATASSKWGLTGTQVAIAAGFAVFVFAGIILVLLTLGK
jgi:hypothetical protein